jgi:hypothetical protein
MVFKVIDEVFTPVADKVEALLETPTMDVIWLNDMCRFLFILKSSLSGLAAGFWLEDQTTKTGGEQVELWSVMHYNDAQARILMPSFEQRAA